MPARMGFTARLKNLLVQGRLEDARALIRGLTPDGLKEEVLRLPPRLGFALCSVLRPARLTELIEGLSHRELQKLLSTATVPELRGLFLTLPERLLPEAFNALPSLQSRELLEKLPKNLQKLLEPERPWPEYSVGEIMSPGGIILTPSDTVHQALEKIRREASDKDQIYHCYILDGDKFLGTVALEDMVLASPQTPAISLMESDSHPIPPEMDRAEAARIMSRYDVQVLPVVKDGCLIGVLPFDDVLDVLQDVNTELFHLAGGLYGDNEEGSLLGETIRRLPCLLLCLVTGVFTTGIIENYESLLSQVMALSFFVPLLIGTGGNTGTQAATLMIRGMSVGDIRWRDLGHILLRESATGLMLGLALAGLAATRSLLLGTGVGVTIVVGVSMISVVLFSNILGAVMPFFVRKTGLDPALLSGPLLATLNDVLGLMLYFSVASMIL